jgi:hypothetical protein
MKFPEVLRRPIHDQVSKDYEAKIQSYAVVTGLQNHLVFQLINFSYQGVMISQS